MLPINKTKFIDEMRKGLYRARKRSTASWTFITEKSGLGMRNIRQWETGDPKGMHKNMPNITKLAQLLHIYARPAGKIENKTDRLVRNFNKCDPQIQKFLYLMADVFSNRGERP